ncbi:MAG: flagellar FlbD family protein [Deferribacteres bacterium]|nr:flagellar FlbD family protein [candidate division KSB1 bacterium]MCB9501931.1 flagellar FlbD family protein [Deferribacteres bacterium]
MIEVTRFNGTKFYINAELVETIEATPDTIVTLTTKSKYVVRESVQDVVQKIFTYKKRLHVTNFGEDLDDLSFKN